MAIDRGPHDSSRFPSSQMTLILKPRSMKYYITDQTVRGSLSAAVALDGLFVLAPLLLRWVLC